RQRAGEVGGPPLHAICTRELLELLGATSDENRVRHHATAIAEPHSTLGANGADRAHQMLVGPHAPGDAVHDDPEPDCFHVLLLRRMHPAWRRAIPGWFR